MDNPHPHLNPKRDHEHSADGCCGGTSTRLVKEEKKQSGCGCGDKHVEPATEKSSCCR
jgi:hypothetical protein